MKTNTYKLKYTFLVVAFLFLTKSILCSVPTTEGLFRNGNNPEVNSDLIMVKLMVTAEEEKELDTTVVESNNEVKTQNLESKKYEPLFIKLLISKSENGRIEIIQVFYKDGKMLDEQVKGVSFISNLRSKIEKSNTLPALYYSILSSLTLNSSNELSTFLKKSSVDFKTNKELINPEKAALYARYKRYLALVNEDESLKETMENPLKPEDPEVRATVKQIMESPFLLKDESISLKKSQGEFVWKIKNDVLEASFDSEFHRLQELEYGQYEDKIKFSLDNYILFNGNHELPKNIMVTQKNKVFKIQNLSLTHLNLGNKSMSKRYNEYLKFRAENKDKADKPLDPLFFM